MIVETTTPEQACRAGAHAPPPAIEIRANGGIGAPLPDQPQARNATGDAMHGEPAQAMDGREVLR